MKRLTSILVAIVVIAILAVGAVVVLKKTDLFKNSESSDYSKYYAVALTTNEVFFGKLTKETADKVVLEDVYFFTYVPDSTQETEKTTSPTPTPSMRPTLIDTSAKDAIAPTNTYEIYRQQIKYMYPLKYGSQVINTIDEYKKNQK